MILFQTSSFIIASEIVEKQISYIQLENDYPFFYDP